MKFGIAGTGKTVSIADCHTAGILADPRAEISAVFNRNRETSEAWMKRHGLEVKACENYESLLESCDAVIICTPNINHFDYAQRAVLAGKHVLCEKPLALNGAQAKALAALAEGRDVVCRVGFVYRFSAGVMALKKLVEEKIGKVYLINARMGGTRLADPRLGMEWRMYTELSGSGALGDFGSHLLDISAYACGVHFDRAVGMKSTVIKQRNTPAGPAPVENDDVASIVCMSGDTVGSFTMSRAGMDMTSFLVVGEGGSARLEIGKATELFYMPKEPEGAYTGNTEILEVRQENIFREGFGRQIRDFIDAVERKESEGADFSDGAYVENILDYACSEL